MADLINSVISPFEENINPGYPTGLKLYLQATKEIYKEYGKLNIKVSNAKDTINHLSAWIKIWLWTT